MRIPVISALLLTLALGGCFPMGKTFDATTASDGHLKASDAAAHSKAVIRREGRTVTVQDAYRFDLGSLVDVDDGYRPSHVEDEGELTREESIVSTAIHGAFGLGTFDPVLDRLKTSWAQDVMARTRVGRPFFVKSLSPRRDDYWVVPVFFRNLWAVASHVGVSPRGNYYSNGFTVPKMPLETAASTTAYGLHNLEALVQKQVGAPRHVERVYVDRIPEPADAVLGYEWLVETASATLLIDPQGKVARLTPEQAALALAGKPLGDPVKF